MTEAVTASTRAAAEAGRATLEAGGNAVDAAVATALASCVADPCNTGLGGYGGHMVLAEPGAEPVTLDFNLWLPRESAGARAKVRSRGPAASVIPNVVAGLERALAEWGTLDWPTVSAPALALARDGVEADGAVREAFRRNEGAEFLGDCFETGTSAGTDGPARFRQPALAATLGRMATEGPRWFYEGPVGETAVPILRDAGHGITMADWRRAPEAVTIAPAPRLDIDGVRIASAPLGTSGSLSMFATVAAGIGIARAQPLDTPEAVVAWAGAIARIWSYRFGTPAGNSVEDGLEAWIDRALAFRERVPVRSATGHTCHLNVCDSRGTLVAMTLTHGPSWFGARWAVPGTGVIMNAGGPLLAAAATKLVGPRAYGVTNLTPTIVRTDDGRALAIGTPGGRRIPSIVGLSLVRHLFGGQGLSHAIRRGRFHAETHDLVTLEDGRWDADVVAAAEASPFGEVGRETAEMYYGPCSAIARAADGTLEVGLDDRWPAYAARLSDDGS